MEDNKPNNQEKTENKTVSAPTVPRHRRTVGGWVIGIAIAAGLCFVSGYAGVVIGNDNQSSPGLVPSKSDGNTVMTTNEKDLSTVVDKVSPSVVSILSTGTSKSNGVRFAGAGTGMIVSKDGYILTNKHVVDGVSNVTVVGSDGKTYDDVSVIGTDPLNDVAFLKINGVKNLPAVTLGDSKTVRVGQSVIAIGNALGQYQNTVTTGIISGLGRPVLASSGATSSDTESLSDLLQTDAAINSGNSGGPLLNMQGQVIGMNTAVAENAQSIGFAIPIGATKGILKHLIKTGKIVRAIIGVQYVSISPEVKAKYNLSVDHGDYITSSSGSPIRKNSPAQKAGLQAKDIITKVNDETVGAGKSTSTLIGEFQPDDTVTLTILRDGKAITKDVTLAGLNS